MTAPTLSTELREAIATWFTARRQPMDSALILDALADLAAEQIAANPTYDTQCEVFGLFTQFTIVHITAANRRRMGGVECELVVKQ